MSLASVAVDEAITAALMNQLIANVNGSPNRVIFTSSGLWTQPAGCHRFKVTLCGGGGGPGRFYDNRGGDSPMVSYIHAGSDVGTSFVVTVGAAGVKGAPGGAESTSGGTTSFGTLLSSTGGIFGTSDGFPAPGGPGSATFPPGAPNVYHMNGIFLFGTSGQGYGSGGPPVNIMFGESPTVTSTGAMPGVVIIEW